MAQSLEDTTTEKALSPEMERVETIIMVACFIMMDLKSTEVTATDVDLAWQQNRNGLSDADKHLVLRIAAELAEATWCTLEFNNRVSETRMKSEMAHDEFVANQLKRHLGVETLYHWTEETYQRSCRERHELYPLPTETT